MDPSLILTVVGSIATLLGAVIGGKYMKRSTEKVGGDHADAAFKLLGAMNDRLEAAEKSIGALNDDLGKERDHSATQDSAIKKLEDLLHRAVIELQTVWSWIDGGAKPPPPVRPEWLNNLPGWRDRDT